MNIGGQNFPAIVPTSDVVLVSCMLVFCVSAKLLSGLGPGAFCESKSRPGLRGCSNKLYKQPCHLNIKRYFLVVVDTWNKLPKNVNNSCTVNILKIRLDCYIWQKAVIFYLEKFLFLLLFSFGLVNFTSQLCNSLTSISVLNSVFISVA